MNFNFSLVTKVDGGGVFLIYFFNWRKIALQCCVGFCHPEKVFKFKISGVRSEKVVGLEDLEYGHFVSWHFKKLYLNFQAVELEMNEF